MRTSLDLVSGMHLKPGDLLAGHYVPDAPTTPVQLMAAALRLTEVTPYTDDDGRKMLALTAGEMSLFPVAITAQVFVIRGVS